jgi:YegS/Rv2252/BmrU family lipid kinase
VQPGKYLAIVNPIAGNGKYLDRLDRIKSEFIRRSIPYDLHFTSETKKADVLTQSVVKEKKYTDLLIVGGDGTINEAINGLGNIQIPVGVISIGTGNDTIKHIQPSFDFEYQLKTAFEGQVKRLDTGDCNGKLFLNGIGMGFDGKVVQRMAERGKKFQGYFSYLFEVLRILLSYREKCIDAEFNNESLQKDILLMTVAKGTTFGGGFKINPYANNDDGLLDICIIGKIPLLVRLGYVLRMKEGNHRHLSPVSFHKTTEVYIRENPYIVAHMDGEYIGNPPYKIKVNPKSIGFRI